MKLRGPKPKGRDSSERVQKALASAGLGSRRACETLIIEGRVTINGEPCKLGDSVLPGDDLRVDGERVKPAGSTVLLLNKPKGYLCTDDQTRGDLRAVDLLPPSNLRLFSVGRLDRDYEGLLLFTNNGELCQRLTHPKFRVKKLYEVTVPARMSDEEIDKMAQGVWLSEGRTAPMEVRIRKRSAHKTLLTVEAREQRQRLIPRVLAKLGHHVSRVRRISMGPLKLGGLKTGACRSLTREELRDLEKLAEGGA
ncbi:MAG: pseudouridine synthase [Planctomycetota bacterium]